MGDRCPFEITFLASDLEKVTKEIGLPNYEETVRTGVLRWEQDEANYANYEECLRLAEMGVVFVGSHGDGYEYPEGVFVSFEGQYLELKAVNGSPVLQLDEATLVATPGDLAEVNDYRTLRNEALAVLGITWDGKPLPEVR